MKIRLTVDGETKTAEVRELPDGRLEVTLDGAVHVVEASVETGAAPAKKWTVKDEAPAAPAAASGPKKEGSGAPGDVHAPMVGKIIEVRVRTGQSVAQGDALVILEAMKMENEILAPAGGVVASVDVTEGDRVQPGQKLCSIQKA